MLSEPFVYSTRPTCYDLAWERRRLELDYIISRFEMHKKGMFSVDTKNSERNMSALLSVKRRSAVYTIV